jgi:hypothetical protein
MSTIGLPASLRRNLHDVKNHCIRDRRDDDVPEKRSTEHPGRRATPELNCQRLRLDRIHKKKQALVANFLRETGKIVVQTVDAEKFERASQLIGLEANDL